ncbi:hypothetical protein AWV79_12235 [Cupriavidus sp. UYMMa02A]|nr:hypothetical protein AWV79_12235 [Cupriavidus sp. UYMMa02A]
MKPIHWLAALPLAAIYSGGLIAGHVHGLVLGLPFLLAWNGAWAVLTSVIMAVMFRHDGSNADSNDGTCREEQA